MLNLRVTRTIALVVMLAGVLVFSGIADAHHISSEDGTWRQVDWKVSVGNFSWDSDDTYSYHYLFVHNKSMFSLDVQFWWAHEIADTGGTVHLTDQSQGSFSLPPRDSGGVVHRARSGWLNTNPSGLDRRRYRIEASTEMRIRNSQPHSTTRSVSRDSDFFWAGSN